MVAMIYMLRDPIDTRRGLVHDKYKYFNYFSIPTPNRRKFNSHKLPG